MTKTVGGPHGSAAARRKTGSHIHSRSKYTNFFRGFPSSAGTFFFNRGSVPEPGGGSESGRADGCPAKRAQGPCRAHGGQKAGRETDGQDGEREDGRQDRNGRQAEGRGTGGRTGGRQTEAAAKKKRGPGTLRVSGPFLSRMRRTIWPGTRRPSRRSPRRAGRVPRSCRRGQRG